MASPITIVLIVAGGLAGLAWVVLKTAAAEVTKEALKRKLWKPANDDDKLVSPGAAIGPADLQIIIGSGNNYESMESYNPNSVTRTLLVGVKNQNQTHYLSNCKLYLKLHNNEKCYLLDNNFTLNAGQERFIPVVYRHEYINRDNGEIDSIQFSVPIPGGFYGIKQPWFNRGEYFITLKVTTTEAKPCEVVCKVWVDESGKLRLERA